MPTTETELLHLGDDRAHSHGVVNTPVYRASLFSFEKYQEFLDAVAQGPAGMVYSRVRNPTRDALEAKIAFLEGADHAMAFSSGMGAISAALLGLLQSGDHLLVAMCCYGPTRTICDTLLAKMGIETEYFDTAESADLSPRLKPNTRAIYLESPGSLTQQIQDIRAVTRLARERGIFTMIDNTWATPFFQQPLALGVDVVIHTATKYIGGHSDVMGGLIACNAELYKRIQPVAETLSAALSPDDSYLVTRGLRTLAVRLERQSASGLALARWFEARHEVRMVYHPGLPSFPGHALAQSQMSGSSGLFAVSMRDPAPQAAQHAFVDTLTYFLKGVSWGGYESLILPMGESYRAMPRVRDSMGIEDEMYRISVGLESVDDLIADLERAFAARAAAIPQAQVQEPAASRA